MTRNYFDHNATTPISPAVLEVHVQALREVFGNASSIHQEGQRAKQRLETSRSQVARLLNCSPKEVVFVSGGTEGDNLAILGSIRDSMHLITTTIEHPAVLQSFERARERGCEITYVPVGSSGVVDPDDVRRALRPGTALISVMHVNNEVGTIQPLAEIAAIAKDAGALMHSDGVQAAGRIHVALDSLGVDLYTISGHKMYGPKGIGALYVRKGVSLNPMSVGGRHEAGRRAGTENTPAIAAMGAAAELARLEASRELERLTALRDRLEEGIINAVPDAVVNCGDSARAPNTTNIRFDGVEGEAIVIALDLKGFAVSSGAACSSGAVEPSHVLTAIGLSKLQAKSSIRFSLGRSNTVEQVDSLIAAAASVVNRLRKLSPDYVAHA